MTLKKLFFVSIILVLLMISTVIIFNKAFPAKYECSYNKKYQYCTCLFINRPSIATSWNYTEEECNNFNQPTLQDKEVVQEIKEGK